MISGQVNLQNYIRDFYKQLFGVEAQNNCSMIETETANIPQISIEENNILTADFMEQ